MSRTHPFFCAYEEDQYSIFIFFYHQTNSIRKQRNIKNNFWTAYPLYKEVLPAYCRNLLFGDVQLEDRISSFSCSVSADLSEFPVRFLLLQYHGECCTDIAVHVLYHEEVLLHR